MEPLAADRHDGRFCDHLLAAAVAGSAEKLQRGLRHRFLRRGVLSQADALDHLDCPADELERRIRMGRLAAGLAHSDEAPIRRALVILEEALNTAEIRMGALA